MRNGLAPSRGREDVRRWTPMAQMGGNDERWRKALGIADSCSNGDAVERRLSCTREGVVGGAADMIRWSSSKNQNVLFLRPTQGTPAMFGAFSLASEFFQCTTLPWV